MTSTADMTQDILRRCAGLGFALAGVCDAQPTGYEREMQQWIEAGMHGEMEYMARTLALRLDPTRFVPGARSIICVADRYHSESAELIEQPGGIGRIARYARGKDYHRIMRDRLGKFCRTLVKEFPGHRFRSCVDTAPVLEREHAQRAGIGAVGKNTMLIQRSVGSWLLLGEIITTLQLEHSPAAEADPCGTCARCIDACPTQAIAAEGWRVDATRCISYLTIEHQSVIDERYHTAIGDWVFGCDICQEVCPHNQPKSQNLGAASHPAYAPRQGGFDLLSMLRWTENDRTQVVINSALKRARLDMMQRNAVIAAGNALAVGTGLPDLLERLVCLAATAESSMVRETAQVVLRRLYPNGS